MTNWSGYEICADLEFGGEKLSTEEVSEFLSDKLFSGTPESQDVLKKCYDRIKTNFGKGGVSWCQDGDPFEVITERGCALFSIDRGKMGKIDSSVADAFDFKGLGLDLPTWISSSKEMPSRKVMIIAQDPKRSGLKSGNIYVSSPFGCHCADYNEPDNSGLKVSDIIKALVDKKKACVYLTDFGKFYAAEDKLYNVPGRLLKGYKAPFQQMFKSAIEKEVEEVVAPDVILTFGEAAIRILNVEFPKKGFVKHVLKPWKGEFVVGNRKIPCFATVHPSKACKNGQKKVMQAGNGYEALLDYYLSV